MTAGPRALQLIRAAYGTVLLACPGAAIRLATGRPPSRRVVQIARVLGARHLAQAALTISLPSAEPVAAGARIDALHAASMLVLAAFSRPQRRAALTDAMVETSFSAAGLTISSVRV